MGKWEGATAGAFLGLCVGGPIGAVIGGVIGGAVSGDDKKSSRPGDETDRLPSGHDQGCPPPQWDQPGPRNC